MPAVREHVGYSATGGRWPAYIDFLYIDWLLHNTVRIDKILDRVANYSIAAAIYL